MASKDRIARLKEDTRMSILKAALHIAKEEGWEALSMRKIADAIDYTAPIIYEYFENKDALLYELTRTGYLILNQKLEEAKSEHDTPEKQLEAMWLAYWNFAFLKKELYQLMYGISTSCNCSLMNKMPEAEQQWDIFAGVIAQVMHTADLDSEELCLRYYTFWSVVHGLISINILSRGSSDDMNRQVLMNAITGIIRSITDKVAAN
jgi:AcrR family transcriptional regulator